MMRCAVETKVRLCEGGGGGVGGVGGVGQEQPSRTVCCSDWRVWSRSRISTLMLKSEGTEEGICRARARAPRQEEGQVQPSQGRAGKAKEAVRAEGGEG